MVHSVSGCTRGVQVKLQDPLRTRAIPERLKGVITTRRYTNPRSPYLTFRNVSGEIGCSFFCSSFFSFAFSFYYIIFEIVC